MASRWDGISKIMEPEKRSGRDILESTWKYLRSDENKGRFSNDDFCELFFIFKQALETFDVVPGSEPESEQARRLV